MLLGAYDYYGSEPIPTLQIVPDAAHWTLDVPDLAQPCSLATAPGWRWLFEPWTLPVPETSEVVTNLAALRGEPVTEVTRWDEDQWGWFAGRAPDVMEGGMRIVPLGTLLAVDPSLAPILSLPVGGALRRDSRDDEWHAWSKSSDAEL